MIDVKESGVRTERTACGLADSHAYRKVLWS